MPSWPVWQRDDAPEMGMRRVSKPFSAGRPSGTERRSIDWPRSELAT